MPSREQSAEAHPTRSPRQTLAAVNAGTFRALGGEGPCQKMLMDRIWPPRKAQPINVRMPAESGHG